MGFPAVETGPDVLDGRLLTNHQIVLADVRFVHHFPGRTRMEAKAAFVGGEVPDDLLFSSVEFQVGGLTELATVRPLASVTFPRELVAGAEIAMK